MTQNKLTIVIDTETTGLNPQWCRIIEVAAVVWSGGDEISSFSSLCNPGKRYLSKSADKALSINNITREEIQKAPSSADVSTAFDDYMSFWLSYDPRVTAYNIPFDRRFLALKPFYMDEGLWSGPDAMHLAKRVIGGSRNPKLDDALMEIGVPYNGESHRALEDARHAADLLWHCEQILFGELSPELESKYRHLRVSR